MVSIIVPVYRVEKYLSNCVESILNQTYRDFELILVDDGSPDQCPQLCDRWAEQDGRIRVIHKKNGGLSDARNVGIEAARGEYITFVDSDDFLLPDMVEVLLRLCRSHGAKMACCGFIRCEDDDTLETVPYTDSEEHIVQYRENKMEAFLRGDSIGTQACAKLYHRSLFQTIRYPYGKYHEDVFTTYQLVHLTDSLVSTDRAGYVYRRNPVSIMMKFSPKRIDGVEGTVERAHFIERHYPELRELAYPGVIVACNQCLTQMAKAGYRDRELERTLQKMYRTYGVYYRRSKGSRMKRTFVRLAELNLKAALVFAKLL